jgi:hypothetical protein
MSRIRLKMQTIVPAKARVSQAFDTSFRKKRKNTAGAIATGGTV